MSNGPRRDTKLQAAAKGQSSASPIEATNPARGTHVLTKTKICKFNLAGCCSKGSACTFAHDLNELKDPPDFARTTLCKFVRRQGWCKDPECKFAHSPDELKRRVAPKAAKLQPETSTNAAETMVMTSATAGGDMDDAFHPKFRTYIHDHDLSWHIDRLHAFMVYGMNEDMDKGSLEPPFQCTISGTGTTAGTVSPHRTVTQDFKSQQRHSHCPVAGMSHDMDRKCLEPSSQHEDSIDCLADVTLRPNGTVVPDLVYQNLYNSYPVGRTSSNMDT
jgi:hypothetical protein